MSYSGEQTREQKRFTLHITYNENCIQVSISVIKECNTISQLNGVMDGE